MQSFEDTGLREELLNLLEEEDVVAPTALQAAMIPALRRGGNLVARASAGSGKTLAYTLGILDRLKKADGGEDEDEETPGLRMLVLVPTGRESELVASTIVPFARSVELDVAAAEAGWGTDAADAQVLVATPAALMSAVQGSEAKLDAVEAVVVDGASVIEELGQWEVVDSVLDLVPRDAQRIVVSSAFTEAVEDLVARRVKRALRYPSEPAVTDPRDQPSQEGAVRFVVSAEGEKFDLLALQLRAARSDAPPPILFCRSDERAAALAEQLALRGFLVGDPSDADADVAIAAGGATRQQLLEEVDGEAGQTISYDVPADAETLVARHGADGDAVVMVTPRELAHLREIARQARYEVRSAPLPGLTTIRATELETFRTEIRRAVREEDLSAQMLVLEPLFEEFTPAEVAAAASALLRSRRSVATPVESAQPSARESAPTRPAEARTPAAGPAPATWARLFVGVGSRDDVRPGDLVGALAGEADIPGSRIGKIEIRDSFSIVEVEADVAERVIRAVNGTTLKGRSVRVDFDRGGPARRPPPRGGGGGPRRTTRRPPSGDR